jgi:LuxR family maltose regulon positive regulatory protein
MADLHLVLKTTPPRTHRTALPRARLKAAWDELRERTTIVVRAKQGFGKTTLLAQWRRLWLEQGALVAWVTLDGDDDPTRFALALLSSMRSASGRAVFDKIARQVAEQPTRDLGALTSLLSEVAALATPTVLMLDEAETLPEETARTSLAYLLANAPPNLHVVVGTRAPLPVPTVDLAAHGDFGELTTRDLRLELDESVAILLRRFGRRISVDDCARLHELTEGWPIGLQLAAASIEREPDLHAAVGTLSARRGDIERHFIETLFQRLPAPIGGFLTRIAILDSIEPDLCAAVTGAENAAAFLDQLTVETPILIAGELSGWVRIHPLARDFLLARFEGLPESEQAELHHRAARWLADRDRFHEAGRHALAAGEDELARTFARRALWDLAREGRLYEARAWLDRLPEETLADDDHLCLVAAWVMALTGRPEVASDVAGRALLRDDLPDALKYEAMLVAGCAAAYADRIGLLEPLLAPWQAPPAGFEGPVHIVAYANTAAMPELFAGRTDRVRALLEPHLAKHSTSETLTMAITLSRVIVALSRLWDGDVDRVLDTLRGPLVAAERESGRRSVVPALYASVLAAALLEHGDAPAARALLADRLDVIERAGMPDTILLAYRTLADVASDAGDDRAALEALRQLHALGSARGVPRLVLSAVAGQIRVHALRQHGETVAALLAELAALERAFEQPEFAPLMPQYRLAAGIARAYAALSSFDFDAAERELKAADAEARDLSRGGDALTIKLLRAVTGAQRGDAGSRGLLAEALDLARLKGNERLRDATHPFVRAMAAERARMASEPAHPHARGVEAAVPEPPAQRAAAIVAGGMLTPKEAEVLRLLNGGMSNKLIAKTMDISDETVKWHLKNLFSKLSAGTRRHAVDRARLLGLITG